MRACPSKINKLSNASILKGPLFPAWGSGAFKCNSIAYKRVHDSISILKALQNSEWSQVKGEAIQ
jgi:hypothetical protein